MYGSTLWARGHHTQFKQHADDLVESPPSAYPEAHASSFSQCACVQCVNQDYLNKNGWDTKDAQVESTFKTYLQNKPSTKSCKRLNTTLFGRFFLQICCIFSRQKPRYWVRPTTTSTNKTTPSDMARAAMTSSWEDRFFWCFLQKISPNFVRKLGTSWDFFRFWCPDFFCWNTL